MDPNHDCAEEIRKQQRADSNRLLRGNTIPELDPVDSTQTNPAVPTTLPPTVAPDPVDSTPTTAMTPDRTDPWEKLPSPQCMIKVFLTILYIVGFLLSGGGVYYFTIPKELKQFIPKPSNGDNDTTFTNTRAVVDTTDTTDPSDFTLPPGNFSWGKVLNTCPEKLSCEILNPN